MLLIIATMYALLFSLLKALGTPPTQFLTVVGFCTLVGFGQAALFRGKKPRLASFLVGGVVYSLAGWFLSWRHGVAIDLIWAFLMGGAAGYVIGCLIGGAFLVLKLFAKQPGERQTPDVAEPAADGDTEDDSN
jgi:hypothetical protein